MPSHDDVWVTRGFEAFRRGTFGNAGQNLYVSRAGVLQRIHHLDFNRDGYVDLVFCNAQVHMEAPPAYVYRDVFGARQCTELPAGGSPTAAVADISGDGYADLVIGNEKSGNAGRLNANIYFGSPEGLSERYQTLVPAHKCTSVAAGDFDGDGRVDLAFMTEGKVRLFYQTDLGIEAKRYVDTGIEGVQLGAADLDGDGLRRADRHRRRPAAPHLLGRRGRTRPRPLHRGAGAGGLGASRPGRDRAALRGGAGGAGSAIGDYAPDRR